MNRPKKQFIPTTLSDLNIDSLSMGSNNDRQNNNTNGARLNNFDRFKATSSSNISYKHSNLNSNTMYDNNNNNNNIGFSRMTKIYGSQSNLSSTSSTGSRYQTVHNNNSNNYNLNPPKLSAQGDMDKWLQAWEDNNNNFRAPSYHPAKQTQSHETFKTNTNRGHAIEYKRTNSNRNSKKSFQNQSADPFDPFDDPWSGTWLFLLISVLLHTIIAPDSKIIVICFHYHRAPLYLSVSNKPRVLYFVGTAHVVMEILLQ